MPIDAHRPSIAERRASFMKTTQEQSEQGPEEKPFVARNINMCQVEKFTALFEKYFVKHCKLSPSNTPPPSSHAITVLDVDKDGFITENDVEALNEKIFDFTGWDREDVKANKLVEYHKDLFKCLLAEINKEVQIESHKKTEISLNNWLKLWDHSMHRALAIFHLPQWVQVMPYNLFTFLDKYGRGYVTKQNLFEFYTDFMLLDDKKGKLVADNAWFQMTGNGDFKLTLDVLTMAFSNFLFAKNSYGPGLFVLGTFEECVKMKGFKFDIRETED